jgi:hypothetical protein
MEKPPFQFNIRTLLWLTLVVAVGCEFGPPLAREHAPKWGLQSYRVTGKAVELHWPTGRVEMRDDEYGITLHLLEDLEAKWLTSQK